MEPQRRVRRAMLKALGAPPEVEAQSPGEGRAFQRRDWRRRRSRHLIGGTAGGQQEGRSEDYDPAAHRVYQ